MKRTVQMKSWNSLGLLSVIILALFALSCSRRYSDLPAYSASPIITDSENKSVGRFKTSYLAEQIHAYFRGNAGGPIAVSTFVDLDDLYSTSTFGRVLSEQLMSELVMLGYNVIELRKADALQLLPTQGEFALSRDTRVLKSMQDIAGMVVGTYVDSPIRVYVNARLIDPSSSMIISAGSVEMEKTREIAKLVRRNHLPATLERIPVRHLGYSSHPVPYYWPWPYMPPAGSYGYSRFPFDEEGELYPNPRGPGRNTDLPEGKHKPSPEPKLEPTT